ncbi:hypothetical protein PGB90_003693 [Kerria lacca]
MSVSCKRSLETTINYAAKRRKLKHTSFQLIQKLINSTKGEAIQALHMVFENNSFSFETQYFKNISGKFISYLNLEGYSFIGYGNSKAASRSSASKTALLFLFDDLRNDYNELVTDPIIVNTIEVSDSKNDLPDIIASLVLNKYDIIRDQFNKKLPWFKIIAGIVMIQENDYDNGKVLVISTGTKCIEPKNISMNGVVILDSHAEILSRRAFQYFLYSQLKNYENDSDSVLLKTDNGKYELKKNINLYLFVNSAPCGDCRIFAVSGKDNCGDKHPNRASRGMLRIKLDGGNSTVPINNYTKYEKDRLMIMSCSDKLLKMNVLGIQGSLLSKFIKPIYMTGIVIGDLFHKSHLSRALYGRIGGKRFIEPFYVNNILVYGITKELSIIRKCPKINVNWIYGESVEIMNSTTGKTVTEGISRLSKYSLFEKFIHFLKKDTSINDINETYDYFKKTSKDYQNAKEIFYNSLESKNLGKWIRREYSFDHFYLKLD